MSFEGKASGTLTLEISGRLGAELILKFHPELQTFLDDITNQGWKYLYIDTKARALSDANLLKVPYTIYSSEQGGGHGMGEFNYTLQLELGNKVPEITAIPEVEEFVVNVSTKNYPRAATVEMSKGVVTYLHEPFWKWEKGWENDKNRLAEAKEVYEIAKWLVEERKLKLNESLKLGRYQELSSSMKEIFDR